MRQLAERSGFPKSMIQHYLREGLLPKPRKPTPNSALYGEVHVERLRMIRRARVLLGERPPAGQLRRVVELVAKGVEPEVAVALQRAVWAGTEPEESVGVARSANQLADTLSVPASRVRELIDSGVLVTAPDAEDQFDEMDSRLARRLVEASTRLGTDLELLGQVSALLRRASALEMEMRNQAVEGRSAQEAAEISADLQELANVWHPYVLFRARQWDIARQGLGPTEAAPPTRTRDSSAGEGGP